MDALLYSFLKHSARSCGYPLDPLRVMKVKKVQEALRQVEPGLGRFFLLLWFGLPAAEWH
jgi:hypothetical protein